jgi:hypothetical protein
MKITRATAMREATAVTYNVIENAAAPARPASAPAPAASRLWSAARRLLAESLPRRETRSMPSQVPAEDDWNRQLRCDLLRIQARRIH